MTPVTRINASVGAITVPDDLRRLPGWLMWRYEYHEGETKPRKVPYYASGLKRHGVQGRPEDREQLATFEAARTAAARRGFDGVGLAPMPEFNIVALDFDHCVADGRILPEVEALLGDTYAEFSPSGHGVRAFFQGQLGNHKDHGGTFGFETFSSKGFVTLTGNATGLTSLMGNENTIAPITPGVAELCRQRFGRAQQPAAAPSTPVGLTDGDLDAALDVLDPSMGHDDWLAVGMALHHETQGLGFERWDSWSALSDKYPGREVLVSRWNSFGKTNDRTVTARSLVRMANAAGAHIQLNGPASMEEFDALATGAGPTTLADEFPSLPAGNTSDKPNRFPVIPAADFVLLPPPRYLIRGLIPEAEVVVLFGDSGSGKSFFALDMAMAMARGQDWRQRRTRQGRVVYIAAEGAGGMRNRLKAYAEKNSLDLSALPFGLIKAAPNMLLKDDALDLARSIAADGPAMLVIVDTWAQVTPGANENAGEDMGKALTHCKGIHRATGATVLLIHHSGKDASKGARGWSGLRAAADAELEVIRTPSGRLVRVSKQKDGEDGEVLGFELDVVNVGLDDEGEIVTSCVVRETQPPSGAAATRRMGPIETVVNAVIQEFAQAQTEGIEVEHIIVAALAKIEKPEGRRDTRRQHVRRAIDSLCRGDDAPYFLEDGCVGVS